jgi:hypothetical protein
LVASRVSPASRIAPTLRDGDLPVGADPGRDRLVDRSEVRVVVHAMELDDDVCGSAKGGR